MFHIYFLLFLDGGIGGKSGESEGRSSVLAGLFYAEILPGERVSFRESQPKVTPLNPCYVISVTDCRRKENVLFVGSVTPRTECGEPRKSFECFQFQIADVKLFFWAGKERRFKIFRRKEAQ